MKHSRFISRLDESRILAAIADADAKTTGVICVMVSKRSHPDALAAAKRHFKALKLDRRPEHNAVLIFVAPRSQTFAIYGDIAVHVRSGKEFWDALRDEMASRLKDSKFTEAILHAIDRTGELLAREFPRNAGSG